MDSQQFLRRGAKFLRAASRRLSRLAPPLSAVVLLAGCTPSTPAPEYSSSANAAHTSSAAPATKSVLERWWNVWSQSSKTPTGSTPGANNTATEIPIVAVDVAAVAARHPAWQLANALEENRVDALRFEPISGSGAGEIAVASPSFDVDFSAPQTAATTQTATPEEFFGDSPNSETQEVAASGLETLESTIANDQRESITEFLRLVSQRQDEWRGEYSAILKTALDEDVAAMQRSGLPPLAPLLPSPEMQLEMTNLQLQISRNIFATEQEVEATRARLNALLNQWRQDLRDQQQQRLAELQRLRVEEPAQAKQAGLARIEDDLATIERAQQVAQTAIAQEHRARVEQDFGDEKARLGIALPVAGVLANGVLVPATKLPSTPAGSALAALGLKESLVFSRTNPIGASSISAVTATAAMQNPSDSDPKTARIQALRTLAWREATKQIQMASRRSGWQWRSAAQAKASRERSGKIIPDRTREVLQILFGATS